MVRKTTLKTLEGILDRSGYWLIDRKKLNPKLEVRVWGGQTLAVLVYSDGQVSVGEVGNGKATKTYRVGDMTLRVLRRIQEG